MLLDLAESLDSGAPALGALPMVQRTVLEQRVMTILTSDVRPSTRPMVMIPVLGVAVLTLGVAAAQPARFPRQSDDNRRNAATLGVPSAAEVSGCGGRQGPTEIRFEGNVPVAVANEAQGDRDSACRWEVTRNGSFSGNMSFSDSRGGTVIREQVGSHGSDRVILKDFGDLRLCMVAEGIGARTTGERPSQWLDRASRIILESQRGNAVHRLELSRQAGDERTIWRVGGAERPFDAAAQQWRSQALAALDTTWELSMLRGNVSSLRGEISSIHGERSSLEGEISSLRGEISSMEGSGSSVRGEESSLLGEISSIRGHVSSLEGAISSARGAISSLNASHDDSDLSRRSVITTRMEQHQAEIARLERALRDYNADARVAAVEKRIAALDADGKVAEITKRIKAFDLKGREAAIQRRIVALDLDRRVAEIDRQITALDADRRGSELEQRRDQELKRLEAAIAALR